MAEKYQEMGRLAMRHEGLMWNAYYALPNTMEGAILIGSIAMRAISGPGTLMRKQAFMAMMKSVVGDILKDATGSRPKWQEPHDAPESERAGHA